MVPVRPCEIRMRADRYAGARSALPVWIDVRRQAQILRAQATPLTHRVAATLSQRGQLLQGEGAPAAGLWEQDSRPDALGTRRFHGVPGAQPAPGAAPADRFGQIGGRTIGGPIQRSGSALQAPTISATESP